MDAMPSTDVLYVTRIQKERFPLPEDYEKVGNRTIWRLDYMKTLLGLGLGLGLGLDTDQMTPYTLSSYSLVFI